MGLEAIFGGLFGGGNKSIASPQAQNASKTAQTLDQPSESARKEKLRKASAFTKDWDKPKLSQPGLLGVSNEL